MTNELLIEAQHVRAFDSRQFFDLRVPENPRLHKRGKEAHCVKGYLGTMLLEAA